LASFNELASLTTQNAVATEFEALDNEIFVFIAYLLPFTATHPLLGKLCDIFGRVAIFNGAVFLFVTGCVLCATSEVIPVPFRLIRLAVQCASVLQRLAVFVSGRILQAIGAAGQRVVGIIVLFDLTPMEAKGYWFGE
jgi:MFS family permease